MVTLLFLTYSHFHLFFAFKETCGRPEVSRRQRGEKPSHYVVVAKAGDDNGLQKLVSRLKKCPDKNGDYVKKIAKGMCYEFFQSILLINIFLNFNCVCIFTFWTFISETLVNLLTRYIFKPNEATETCKKKNTALN